MMNLISDKWQILDISDKIYQEFISKYQVEYTYLINNESDIYLPNDCHNNVNKFLKINGHDKYSKILGYYLLTNVTKTKIWAIQHSVIFDLTNECIIDITPCYYKKKLFIYHYLLPEYKQFTFDGNIIFTEKTLVSNIDGYMI